MSSADGDSPLAPWSKKAPASVLLGSVVEQIPATLRKHERRRVNRGGDVHDRVKIGRGLERTVRSVSPARADP